MSKKFVILLLIGLVITSSGCGQWNIFKWAHKEGTAASSDTTVLVADGQALLDKGDYAKAEEVFEKAMNANIRGSEANYGYAQAVISASGLGLANLISSVIQQAKTGAPLPSSNPFINFVSAQYALSEKLLDPAKLDLTKLYDVSKKAIAPLKRIADGETDAVIPADDFDVNFNLAFLLVIRGVCNVLDTDADGYIGGTEDIIQVSGDFDFIDPATKQSIFDPSGELTEAFKNKVTNIKEKLKEQIILAITDIELTVVQTSYGQTADGGYLGVALEKISPEAAEELKKNSSEFKTELKNLKEKIAEL